MDRRRFLGTAAAALLAGVAIQVTGCSEDTSGPAVATGDIAGQIAGNHGHSVVLRKAEIDAAGDVTLTLSGGGHDHTVALTAAQVASIRDGGMADVTSSSSGGHSHNVHFMKG
jgi:hypothetical protein